MPTDLAGSGSIDRQRAAIPGKATICRARCLFNLGRHGHRKATCPYETPGRHGHLRCGKATIRRRQATCPSGSVGREELVKYGMSTTLNRSVTNQCRHVERRIVYGNNDRLDCHSTISVQPCIIPRHRMYSSASLHDFKIQLHLRFSSASSIYMHNYVYIIFATILTVPDLESD
jgi:hypothetical protein